MSTSQLKPVKKRKVAQEESPPPAPKRPARAAKRANDEETGFEIVGVTKKSGNANDNSANALAVPIVLQQKEDDSTFQIAVKLHSRYARFPPALRNTIEKTYTLTLAAQLEHLKTNNQSTRNHTYSIIAGRCVRPLSAGFTTTTRTYGILDLSVANVQLLEQFVENNEEAVRSATFVVLKTQEGLANPDFIHLHCVRHGELGWGLDCNDCLSLYWAKIVDQKLEEHVVYVERVEARIKEEV